MPHMAFFSFNSKGKKERCKEAKENGIHLLHVIAGTRAIVVANIIVRWVVGNWALAIWHNIIQIHKSVLCGTDNILWIIPTFNLNIENITPNIVNPTKHSYGYHNVMDIAKFNKMFKFCGCFKVAAS